MSRALLRLITATTLSAGFLTTAAHAQVSGIEAYRTQPQPAAYAPLVSDTAVYRTGQRRDLLRAQAALDRGDFLHAARLLDTRSPQANSPEGRYLSAVANSGLGRYARARSLFGDALAQAPGHVGARLGLALTDLRLGRRADATAQLAVLEQRQAACASNCADAVALDRATHRLRHFLEQAPAL